MNQNRTFCMSANISSVGIREAHVMTTVDLEIFV